MVQTEKRSAVCIRSAGKGLMAVVVALCLLLVLAAPTLANTVRINDAARLLDRNQVYKAASSLNYPVDIYTVNQNQFAGTAAQFDRQAQNKVRNNPNLIVIAINDSLRRMYIAYGSQVPLSAGSIDAATTAFRNGYSSGGYTQATVNTLNSLQTSLGATGPSSGSNPGGTPAPAPASGGSNFAWCLIGLLVLGAIALMVLRRRASQQAVYGQPGSAWRPDQGPNIPLQNYPSVPGYQPGYAGGYGPRQGMNPWAAGGLGAAAGGILGYGLGRQAGEREAEERGQNVEEGRWGGGYGGGGSDFGEGRGGYGGYGGGGGGDYGGGDYGGGGGSDYGGSGSGSDFGSGGSKF